MHDGFDRSIFVGLGPLRMPRCLRSFAEFLRKILNNPVALGRMQLCLHSTQSEADDVTVMNLRTQLLAQFEPHLMSALDVLGPESWWMGTEIHEHRRPSG